MDASKSLVRSPINGNILRDIVRSVLSFCPWRHTRAAQRSSLHSRLFGADLIVDRTGPEILTCGLLILRSAEIPGLGFKPTDGQQGLTM